MSQITDFAASVKTNFAAIQTGITALDQKIADLQNSPGTLSPSDQAALDEIQSMSASLATAAATFPPPVPPPAPPAASSSISR